MVSATEAETVDRPATGPEIVALNASVVAKMRARAFGASVPIPSEAKAPRNGKRRPLGLAPIDGDDDKAAAAPAFVAGLPSAAASFTAETLARGAVMADVAEIARLRDRDRPRPRRRAQSADRRAARRERAIDDGARSLARSICGGQG